MRFVVVESTSAGWNQESFESVEALIEAQKAKGYKHTGFYNGIGRRTREELHNQPEFKELCGPMWDGDKVRYENWEAYDRLSR